MVVAIVACLVKAKEPKILRVFDGSFELTEGWARNVWIGFEKKVWIGWKGTTGKNELCHKFLEEEKFTFQRAISKFISDHDMPLELVLNLDQTLLSYVSPGRYIFDLKISKAVLIKGVNDKRHITATFTVTASVSFLPNQLSYSGKTKRSIPKYDFPGCFDITVIPNHWSNYEKCVNHWLRKIIFPYLKAKKEELGYPKEQYSLIVMNIFKGRDTPKLKNCVWKMIANWLLHHRTPWCFYQSKSKEVRFL